MRCRALPEQSRSTTPLGKTRQVCWQGVHKLRTKSLAERLDLFALRIGEAEGIDLLLLESGDERVGLPGAGERPRDEPVGLAPSGDMRTRPVEQPTGLALDPPPV